MKINWHFLLSIREIHSNGDSKPFFDIPGITCWDISEADAKVGEDALFKHLDDALQTKFGKDRGAHTHKGNGRCFNVVVKSCHDNRLQDEVRAIPLCTYAAVDVVEKALNDFLHVLNSIHAVKSAAKHSEKLT